MKLLDVVLFVLSFCFFIIGIDQAVILGLAESYWIFMFSLLPLFLYGYRKNKSNEKQSAQKDNLRKPKKRKHG